MCTPFSLSHLELGAVRLSEFKGKFKEWVSVQEKRNVMVYRSVKGKLKLCDTGRSLSKATIQAYMRYTKAGGHG
ncbi:MAG: hypothetical protein LBI42_06045 [Chitinispirillales bacterium]|nr:hypothetical protein [Chitinispirillales bacterium]